MEGTSLEQIHSGIVIYEDDFENGRIIFYF